MRTFTSPILSKFSPATAQAPLVGRSAAAVEVEVISELSRLEAIEEQWHALARPIAWPMAQFEWIVSAAQTNQNERLHIVAIKDAGTLHAVAPLVLRRHGRTWRLESLDYKLCEPQQLIARDERYMRHLYRAVGELPYPFLLRSVPAGSRDIPCFETLSSSCLKTVVSKAGRDSFVPLNDTIEERMSASRRSTLRRKRKAADKHGSVKFSFLQPRPDELPRLLDEVFQVESSGWKGRAATGLQHDLEQASFFRTYCDRMARLGALRLGFMTINEATAAARIDVVWADESWELKIGYDERFANCSPGLLLSHEALKHGQTVGLQGHHFLGEAESWHDTWAAMTADRVNLRYYPRTLAGATALVQDAGERCRKLVARQFPIASRGG